MDIVAPSPADMKESLRQSMWKPLGAVSAATDAATDAASSPHANSPTQNTGSSPPFGIDPPRPPREGSQSKLPDVVVNVNIEAEHAQSEKHDASAWHRLLHHARFRLSKHKSKNRFGEEPTDNGMSLSTDDHTHHTRAVPGLGKTGTWLREEFGSAKKATKIFGRAPWNRKDSTATFSSVSSSIREVLRGDTPPASPLMSFTTTYHRNTWITNTFPGGEAVRVSTPPMDEDTADGKPRGFFGPLTPPESDTTGSQTYHTPMTTMYASPKYNAHRMSVAVPSREWWEGKPQKPTRHKDTNSVTKFEFDVPEHLPNSPMCPANHINGRIDSKADATVGEKGKLGSHPHPYSALPGLPGRGHCTTTCALQFDKKTGNLSGRIRYYKHLDLNTDIRAGEQRGRFNSKMFFLGNLFYVTCLLINAVAILSEDRFLARINLSPGSHDPGFGTGSEPQSVQAKIVHLIASVRTLMRMPLIIANTLIILYELILG
ncbi:hypothetical protein G3M48_008637 [Beauveria asiatica]